MVVSTIENLKSKVGGAFRKTRELAEVEKAKRA
jgi:hypothetical protein